MNPQTTTPQDYIAFGRSLLNELRRHAVSFEDAAQRVTEILYNASTLDNGSPAFALIRVYRLTLFDELPVEFQSVVDPSEGRWLTLMGTYGHEQAWRNRTNSQAHQVITLGKNISPMMSAALSQLEPSLNVQVPPDIEALPQTHITSLTHYFHVERALGSPYIPAQEGFVKPYGIQSVIGLGNGFLSGSLCFVVAFSTVSLGTEQAASFASLAPYIGTLLAIHDSKRIWS
jgi:hypothetical protein